MVVPHPDLRSVFPHPPQSWPYLPQPWKAFVNIDQAKVALRTQARKRRDELSSANRREAIIALARRLTRRLPLRPSDIVAGYWPTGSEMDCRPFLEAACARHIICALPVVTAKGAPLDFHPWQPSDILTAGNFGIMIPAAPSAPVIPTIVLVPLLAFDMSGHRLGYGGGYYDRTIKLLRKGASVWAIGVAFDVQRVDNLPNGAHDERLNAVATESDFYEFD